MKGCPVKQLNDKFTQIGFENIDSLFDERIIEADLF
jgi:hypothetical protein